MNQVPLKASEDTYSDLSGKPSIIVMRTLALSAKTHLLPCDMNDKDIQFEESCVEHIGLDVEPWFST